MLSSTLSGQSSLHCNQSVTLGGFHLACSISLSVSLVEHLLGGLLEFASTVELLLVGGSRATVSSGVLRGRLLLGGSVLVYNHSLGAGCIFFGCSTKALITFASSALGSVTGSHARLLSNHVQHRVLQGLLVFGETILLPRVVEDASIEVVPVHAALEEGQAGSVVGLLLELERSAILHVLSELRWVTAAELLQGGLDLLLLDIVVLFVLGATWESLPGQLALDEVEEHMSNGFQIVTSALLDTLVSRDRRISGRSRQVLAILVRDVLAL
jgi:hypothetical protein